MRARVVHLLVDDRPDGEDFAVNVQALLGPIDGEGEESFQVTVCTPGWLLANLPMPKGLVFLRHHLVVERRDEALVEQAIRGLCLRTEGPDWTTVAAKLSRYGYWEFEDYRE